MSFLPLTRFSLSYIQFRLSPALPEVRSAPP
nr:MAG TPA: hypothetical protein [Caudoviricetes sp.]